MSERTAVKLTYRPIAVAPIPKVLGTAVPKCADDVSDSLKKKFGDAAVKSVEKNHKGDPFAVVDPAQIVDIMRFLRDDERFYCTNLLLIGAVDYPPTEADAKGRIEVVYHLYSYAHRHQLTVKVHLDREHPHVATVSDLFRAANWYERECFDMIGVEFDNHPHHTRILLPPDWVGHPLRKDYVFPEEYNGMKVPL